MASEFACNKPDFFIDIVNIVDIYIYIFVQLSKLI